MTQLNKARSRHKNVEETLDVEDSCSSLLILLATLGLHSVAGDFEWDTSLYRMLKDHLMQTYEEAHKND